MDIILSPFSWLLEVFYNFFDSYGLALILFALVVKVVLFPLSLKGKRSMIQMNMLSGQMQKLQKQYGNNRERYNLEVQKLYEKEKINPMGGCLWSFIPLIILMVLYPIIREPIHYMMGINDADTLNALEGVLTLPQILEKMSTAPARILGIPAGTLQVGANADVVLFDPQREWVVDPEKLHGKSKNTPFKGMKLKGKVALTIFRGRIVYDGR